MNYIAEILGFHDFMLSNNLTTAQIALWYELMYINNKCAWQEWFQAPNQTLELYTGLSRQGVAKARNILKQKGLIDFKSNGTKATLYKLVSISYCLQGSLQECLQDRLQDRLQECLPKCSTLNKQNKTKQNNNKYNNTSDVSPVIISLTLSGGYEYPVTENVATEYQSLYPGVDVKSELRKMCAWLISNPDRRKTKKGIKRFINSWLSRQQEKGGTTDAGNIKHGKEPWDNSRGNCYDGITTMLDV